MSIDKKYLDGDYLEQNPTFHVEDSAWKATQILKGIGGNGIKAESIAEVGCGAGEILVQLAKKLPESKFTGYELSPQGYALCKTRVKENISFKNLDLFEDKDYFDLILCIDVFEHIEDYFTFLRDLALKAEHFIFHIPLDMNAQMVARAEPIQRVRDVVGHLHYFSKDSALSVLAHCGYEVKDWFYTSNGVDRPSSALARTFKIPRKILQKLSPELTARLLGGYSLLVVAKKRSS